MVSRRDRRTAILLLALLLLALALRIGLLLMFVDDPTHSSGRIVRTSLMYTPHDIKWMLWGNILVEKDKGLYGYVDHYRRHYAYGPMLAYISWSWAKLFGPSIVSMKSLFMIGDLLAAFLVYKLIERLRDARTAIMGALVYSFSAIPLFIGAVRGKEEPLVAVFMLACLLCLLSTGRYAVMLAAIFAAISFAIKPTIVFVLPPIAVYLLRRKSASHGFVFGCTFASLAALLLSIEWARSGVIAYTSVSEHTGYVGGLSIFNLPGQLSGLVMPFPGKSMAAQLAGFIQGRPVPSIAFFVLYCSLVGILLLRDRRNQEIVLLKGCTVGLFLGATIKSVMHSQYIYWPFPFIILLLAMTHEPAHWKKMLPGALLTAIALIWFAVTYREGTPLEAPDSSNILFLILAFLGTMLMIPGGMGKGLALITVGILLYQVGQVSLGDRFFGLQKPYLSMFVNQIFPIVFCVLGYITVLICLSALKVEWTPDGEIMTAGHLSG